MDLYQFQLYQSEELSSIKIVEHALNNDEQSALEEVITITNKFDLLAAAQLKPRLISNKKHAVRRGCRNMRNHRVGKHCHVCRQYKHML